MEQDTSLIENEKRLEQKLKKFLNPPVIALGFLILFSITINIYFFSSTIGQPLWWDEAEYLSIAKHFLFNTVYEVNPQRPPLFPFLIFLGLKLGFGETAIKFIFVIVPSILSVILTYFLVKEMYDMRTALIASIITSVSWIHLFYSMRLMTDAIGLLFGLASVYCFWKGYVKKESRIYIYFIGFFVALSMMVRLTGVLYGLVIFIFLLITDKFRFLKSKEMWFAFFISLLTLVPLFVYDSTVFGNSLAFRSGYGGVPDQGLGWGLLKEVYHYSEKGFFYLFLVGILISLQSLTSIDIIIKKYEKKYLADIFMILTIIVILGFFIYFLRQAENRWLIFMSLAIFTFAAKGVLFIYDLIKKYNKILAIFVLVALLSIGVFYQLSHAKSIIELKKTSYLQIKEASLWMKDNSLENESLFSVSYTQTTAYSDRSTYSYSDLNQSEFFSLVKEKRPKYILVSVLEPHHPEWIYQWSAENPDKLIPRQAYFQDQAKQQPVAIVYEFNQSWMNGL